LSPHHGLDRSPVCSPRPLVRSPALSSSLKLFPSVIVDLDQQQLLTSPCSTSCSLLRVRRLSARASTFHATFHATPIALAVRFAAAPTSSVPRTCPCLGFLAGAAPNHARYRAISGGRTGRTAVACSRLPCLGQKPDFGPPVGAREAMGRGSEVLENRVSRL
jgi:hypothetical protein